MGKAPIRVGLPEGMRVAAQVTTVTGAGVRTPPGARPFLEVSMQAHVAAQQHKTTRPNGEHVPVYRVVVRDPNDRSVEWMHEKRFEGGRERAERLVERIEGDDTFDREHVESSGIWESFERPDRSPAEEHKLRCRIEELMAQLD